MKGLSKVVHTKYYTVCYFDMNTLESLEFVMPTDLHPQ